ncbi:hypothetical protein BDU57DRAFT_519624 [Ampelomyces quisqualis]|uniref:Hydrophobic surface binding protein A-domain-containing protein n=1 Tax=Ampelomyces quisqualis TaxID=50730 RepID=A0A6A5QGD6_AMPQU|nr:hypothetical protein BDU57DRAFT_519624 [Ampelomyces quisqualis]
MQIKSVLVSAALSATVASNFVIVTVPSLDVDIFNIQSQFNSIKSNAASRIADLTASLPTSELSRGASAQQALNSFVATAPSSLSIPARVTDIGAIETLTSTPAWFSALPSDLRSYYESQNAKVQSVVNDAAGAQASSASRSGGAAGPQSTGAAAGSEKVVKYMGVAGAAAVAGVFAL